MTHSGAEDLFDSIEVSRVLIPLLLDDPLWAWKAIMKNPELFGLNPSFAG